MLRLHFCRDFRLPAGLVLKLPVQQKHGKTKRMKLTKLDVSATEKNIEQNGGSSIFQLGEVQRVPVHCKN
jgi:hypothetical protein